MRIRSRPNFRSERKANSNHKSMNLMKTNILLGSLVVLAASLAADSVSKDEVTGAAKALAAKSYSWKTTIQAAGGGGGGGNRGGGPGATEGKVEPDGYTWVSMARGQNTIEGVVKGTKGAVKLEDGWKSFEEATAGGGAGAGAGGGQGGGGRNPGRMAARMLQNFKAPAVQAQEIAGRVKEFTKTDDTISGEFTEDGAKQMLTFGGRRGGGGGGGGNAPEVSGAKGTVKFWIKDGVLTKYQFNVQGKVSFNGNDRDVDRTTTVEFKDVGTTKVSVPEEAAKKAS